MGEVYNEPLITIITARINIFFKKTEVIGHFCQIWMSRSFLEIRLLAKTRNIQVGKVLAAWWKGARKESRPRKRMHGDPKAPKVWTCLRNRD